jgi:hypothetical protein
MRIILLLLFFFVACPNSYGQENPPSTPSGIIEGKVTDSLGNLMPGITVIALDSNSRRETMSNLEGKYKLELPAGNYLIRAGADCLRSFYREHVEVAEGKITTLDITIPAENSIATSVSIYQLIANPEKYHEHLIVVSGFYRSASEESSLYATRDDADYVNVKNSISLTFAKDVTLQPSGPKTMKLNNLEFFDAKYVLIEGIFDKNECGELDGASGAIKSVTRMVEMKRWREGKRELK